MSCTLFPGNKRASNTFRRNMIKHSLSNYTRKYNININYCNNLRHIFIFPGLHTGAQSCMHLIQQVVYMCVQVVLALVV